MKRVRIALCVALFVFLVVPASSFALTVGSPYKNGSLMIFPLVDGSDGVDTVITISNGFYETVDIACRHRTVSDEVGGFTFHLGPYQTAWFSIQTGQGSIPAPMAFAERGELKCWAVDASGGQQISWNYLQGFAQITNADGLSWGYSSWNFKANKTRNKVVGKPGIIKLSGKSGQYDAMPQYLYFSVPGTVTEAQLTLLLGKEDLRQDRQSTYSKAKFYYERGRTSGTQCLVDMVEVSIPQRVLGSFRVEGIASTVCDRLFKLPDGTTQGSPLLGMVEAHSNSAVFGIMPIGVGADGSGYILWDADGSIPEVIAR